MPTPRSVLHKFRALLGLALLVALLPQTALAAPEVRLNQPELRFVPCLVDRACSILPSVVKNVGDEPLAIAAIAVVGDHAADFTQTNTCGAGIAAGGECVVTVLFKPSALGPRTATVRIDSNAPGSPHLIALYGAGDIHEGGCFGATGFCVSPRFLQYWLAHGGLPINGYPISIVRREVLEDGREYEVQYFERVRMEYHPENAAPDDILLGQFGRLLHPADPPVAPQPGQTFFPQTGHNVPPDFHAFWQANGGLAQFGYPLSEVFRETLEDGKQYEVQYFERARFERHPENAPPNTIQLGQFGRRILDSR